jgi:hypothetical protein
VFINGVPTEVPSGAIDMKAMFGENVMLVHSSGVPVPTNEFGILMQSLQHGESYFLVINTLHIHFFLLYVMFRIVVYVKLFFILE